MPNLSRRHLVTTAAALPALAVPAFASDAIGPNHPDAELLRLGAELEAVIVEWHAQIARGASNIIAREAACEAAGLPDIGSENATPDEIRAHLEKKHAICEPLGLYEAVNEDGQSIVWNDIHDRMWPLIDAIMAHKPRTLAGLAVVARAFTLHHAEQWEPDADEGLHHRAFMETVCAFAGVVPVPCDGAPVVAIAREPDPIFALIDKARAAHEAHGRTCNVEPVLASGGLALGMPEYAAWDEAQEAACDASWTTLRELLATPPTTRAGMAAVVRYVTDIPDAEIGKANYRTLLDSLNAHFAA